MHKVMTKKKKRKQIKWDQYLDGQIHVWIRGKDYTCHSEQIQTMACQAARNRGMLISTTITQGSITFQSGTETAGFLPTRGRGSYHLKRALERQAALIDPPQPPPPPPVPEPPKIEHVGPPRTIFEALELKAAGGAANHDADFDFGNWEPGGFDPDDFQPTDAPAGSAEKIDVLAKRVERGQPLWHDDDRNNYEGLTGAIRPRD